MLNIDFKTTTKAVITMFKELKEYIFKELRENVLGASK